MINPWDIVGWCVVAFIALLVAWVVFYLVINITYNVLEYVIERKRKIERSKN